MSNRHDFIVRHDARRLIAPIGNPYGFVNGGDFGFEVFDFDLRVGRRKRKEDSEFENDDGDDEDDRILRDLSVGFLLKRFESESAFHKYEEEYLTNSSHCIYDAFLERDGSGDADVFGENDDSIDEIYASVGEVEDAAGEGIFLPLKYTARKDWSIKTASITYQFKEGEAGLYVLMYQICPHTASSARALVRSSFQLEFHYKNVDSFGMDSFLTAGEMPLPTIYLYFTISYLLCFIVWACNIRMIQLGQPGLFVDADIGEATRRRFPQLPSQQLPPLRPVLFPIHQLMSVLLFLKMLSVLFESVRYHYIRITGRALFWSALYYTVSFVKGLFLFTVILLIGSGWSFVKPFVTRREKNVILFVLVLQVVDNIALIVLSQETQGEKKYDHWSAVLHMVDILCCCAVLVPIVWQVNALEAKLDDDEDNDNNNNDDDENDIDNKGDFKDVPIEEQQKTLGAAPSSSMTAASAPAHQEDPAEAAETARTLSKLKTFRSFYLAVVAYIYFTRIAVYLFATVLDYRHTWVRYVVTEFATLFFYVVTGLVFRPQPDDSGYYTTVNRKEDAPDDEIAAAEQEHEISFDPAPDADTEGDEGLELRSFRGTTTATTMMTAAAPDGRTGPSKRF